MGNTEEISELDARLDDLNSYFDSMENPLEGLSEEFLEVQVNSQHGTMFRIEWPTTKDPIRLGSNFNEGAGENALTVTNDSSVASQHLSIASLGTGSTNLLDIDKFTIVNNTEDANFSLEVNGALLEPNEPLTTAGTFAIRTNNQGGGTRSNWLFYLSPNSSMQSRLYRLTDEQYAQCLQSIDAGNLDVTKIPIISEAIVTDKAIRTNYPDEQDMIWM